MTRLFLIRHGEVDHGNTFYGHLDLPLSPRGKEQLERTARVLHSAPIAAIYCSDLARARESAEIIAARHSIPPIAEPTFREMHLGVLEGMSFDNARQKHPQLLTKRYHHMWEYRFPGGGENLQDVEKRVQPALDRLLEEYDDQSIVLVAHNSVNRVILGRALGLSLSKVFDFQQDFGCINVIEYKKRPRVMTINWNVDPTQR